MRSCYKWRKPRLRLKRRRHGPGSPYSRTGDGWTMGRLGTWWCGRMANPGWASKPPWATTRRPTTQNEPPLQGYWNQLQEDRLRRGKSQSLPMPKPPSDEWPQRSLSPASSTHSRRGSTSLYCGGLGWASLSRSGGTLPTRVLATIKRPTSGQRLQQRSLELVGWDGGTIRIVLRGTQCLSRGRSQTSSARSPRRSGRKPGNGREAGPLKRITAC